MALARRFLFMGFPRDVNDWDIGFPNGIKRYQIIGAGASLPVCGGRLPVCASVLSWVFNAVSSAFKLLICACSWATLGAGSAAALVVGGVAGALA